MAVTIKAPVGAPPKSGVVVDGQGKIKLRRPKFQRLFALGEDKMLRINNMLATGTSPYTIAKIIQQEWGDHTDLTQHSLMLQLQRYKAELETRAMIPAPGSPIPVSPLLTVPPEERLPVVQKAKEVLAIQLNRIKMLAAKEEKLGMPMAQLNKEIETYTSMLEKIQRMQFDLGLDEFRGPLIQGGKVTLTKTQNADGTTVTEATAQAVSTAVQVMRDLMGSNQPFPIGLVEDDPAGN